MSAWRKLRDAVLNRKTIQARPQFDPRDPRFPTFPPPDPETIIATRESYADRVSHRISITPSGHIADTPLFALYRIYEHIILDDNHGVLEELRYFWYAKWPVSSIPDPGEGGSPTRHATLASIPALIVESFNRNIGEGFPRWLPADITDEALEEAKDMPKIYEEVPGWCAGVKRLDETLKIPYKIRKGPVVEELEGFEDPRASPQMAEKNILCRQPDIHFGRSS